MVIQSVDQITVEWLNAALQEFGVRDRVIAIRPAAQTELQGGPGIRPRNFFTAEYSQHTPDDAPRRFYLKAHDGRFSSQAGALEIAFYTRIATEMNAKEYCTSPAPICYHTAFDPITGAYHLLLEDLSATHQVVHPEFPASKEDTECMLSVLARFHTFWQGDARLGGEFGIAPNIDDITADFHRFRQVFPGYLDYLGDRLSLKRRRIYELVLDRYPVKLMERLDDRSKLSIVHNDAHAGNFLLPRAAESNCYIVDWEQWSVGASMADIAYLIALFWYPERRQRMEKDLVKFYRQRCLEYGLSGYSWEACWDDYRFFAINNLLVPLWAWISSGERLGWHRWHQIEKAMLAFEDLNCNEFLR